jgi:hypothetical protein
VELPAATHFDSREFPTTSPWSCVDSQARLRDLIIRSAVAIEQGGFPRILPVPPDHHVRVFWINLHESCFAASTFAPDQGGTRAPEQVQDEIPSLTAIHQGALHQFHR